MTKQVDERTHALEAIALELRFRIVEMVHAAQSGHCGGSLSAADIVTALYFELMNVDPANPGKPDRDRFVLSKGHACPVQYAALALRGYFPVAELKTLRQFHSRLQGHPVQGKLPGIEVTTGSLGVGLCEAVGMALDAVLRKGAWRIWTLVGDGELNEGAVWEAASVAAKYGLDNLTVIVDRNRLQNDGRCDDVMPMDSIPDKFRAFGWEVLEMDGHNMRNILKVLGQAAHVQGRPTCVVARTIKGKGVSFMESMRDWHGKAPTDEEFAKASLELKRSVA
jgi:transketolase